MLGPEKLQLEAPIGYNEYDASDFSTSTSSCGVTGYEYSKPTQYATTNTKRLSMAWKPFTRPTPTPCLSPYIIKEGDDCASISRENSVSTHKLQLKNDLWCHERLSPGVSICLPPKCKTHEIEYGDTCTGLSDRYGVSSQQLVSWNSILDKKCSNIKDCSGRSICVGYIAPSICFPGYSLNPANEIIGRPTVSSKTWTWVRLVSKRLEGCSPPIAAVLPRTQGRLCGRMKGTN